MLTKDDCLVLRGLAIMCIIVHNFCHLLPNAVRENEFFYDVGNDHYFMTHVFTSDFVVQLFSYWGHLGVPVFVFLTGYGLSQKYECSTNIVDKKLFIWRHYQKFIFPILGGFFSFVIVYLVINGSLWDKWWQTFIMQITMTGNFALHPNSLIKPGPYWYFGLTMQLYIIYIFFVYRRSLNLFVYIVTASIIILFAVQSKHYSLIWIKYNSVGWLLPFCIGLYVGRNIHMYNFKVLQLIGSCFISGLLILILGSNYYLWLFISLPSITFFVSVCGILKRGVVYKYALYVGKISFFLFVTHPIIREIIRAIIPLDYRYVGLLLYLIIVVLISLVISLIPNPHELRKS